MKSFVCILFLIFITPIIGAQTGIIYGVILDEDLRPVAHVNISTSTGINSSTNQNGFYSINVPVNTKIWITFSHISLKKMSSSFLLKNFENIEFNPVMKLESEQISDVVITYSNSKSTLGITTLNPENIRKIPGANPGIENILLTLPGVSNNNELSTQYAVRGGNYDENLVYVNDIEVYRPFLIRSGQQEGLSFVNTQMVQNVDFSAGGFPAQYGDKLASVLDITYRVPNQFNVQADLSLLGTSIAVEGLSKNSKFKGIVGARYRNNSLLVDAKETTSNYNPTFADLQSYFTYVFNSKFQISFLGNIALNKYLFKPISRQTNFGTIAEPKALIIYYDGQEKDTYKTLFGALSGTYLVHDNLTLKFNSAIYQTTESEHFDILAQYRLGEVNNTIGDENLGDVKYTRGIGGQLTHGRNDLDALISNFEHKGVFKKNKYSISWGAKYTHENIRDRLAEWEAIDSAGFNVPAPKITSKNEEPYIPYDNPLELYKNTKATNETNINRIQLFTQFNKSGRLGNHEIWYNAGLRLHHWTVNDGIEDVSKQTVISPRFQFALKPSFNKNLLFRLATGYYYQPPFYRELRDANGKVQPQVKAQKAFHLVLGNEYRFNLKETTFKLITEAYYKNIADVNTYTIENVRIRYRANNNATAFAYGLDLRIHGEFVPHAESWFSFGYLKTEENINHQGYIARPTDQRLKFAALFQDYVPSMPNFKAYLNLVYNTGLPGGSPNYANPYQYQNRLPDYKRADFGVHYVLIDVNKTYPNSWKKMFNELSFGFEIYNLFNVQNTITNTWVRDTYSKRLYAVPNYLTPRVFNVSAAFKF